VEGRALLSTLPLSTAGHFDVATGVDVARAVTLRGTVTGRAPLNGSGAVSPLGHVVSVGTLTGRGAEPVVYTGEVTLTGPTGCITADLSGRVFGPTRPGAPINLVYTIVHGTRAFGGATGSGKAVLYPFRGLPGEFALTFGNTPPPPLV
jgi:hypothetical protein